ncbi:MAG: glutathione S-transferase family protein [Gaiellaceae bacterium]
MLTLYDAERCPYCARVRIVLAEKGVEWEAVEIDLDDRPAWIYGKNPLGRVPVLEEDGLVLPESVVIMEYLDERYPEPPLLPADAAQRALARLVVERFERPTPERLDELDAILVEQSYLTGTTYGLADIAYYPWVVRLALDDHEALADWAARLHERPAVASSWAWTSTARS